MNDPNDWDDDRIATRAENIAQEIRESDWIMKQILAEVTSSLPDAMYDDISDALVKLNGTDPDNLLGSDVLTRLYRHGANISQMIGSRINGCALQAAELEAASWPIWRGTMEATQRYAHDPEGCSP